MMTFADFHANQDPELDRLMKNAGLDPNAEFYCYPVRASISQQGLTARVSLTFPASWRRTVQY
jgi:hypothetical protein